MASLLSRQPHNVQIRTTHTGEIVQQKTLTVSVNGTTWSGTNMLLLLYFCVPLSNKRLWPYQWMTAVVLAVVTCTREHFLSPMCVWSFHCMGVTSMATWQFALTSFAKDYLQRSGWGIANLILPAEEWLEQSTSCWWEVPPVSSTSNTPGVGVGDVQFS